MDQVNFARTMQYRGETFRNRVNSTEEALEEVQSFRYLEEQRQYMNNLRSLEEQEYRNRFLGYLLEQNKVRNSNSELIASATKSLRSFSISRPQSPDSSSQGDCESPPLSPIIKHKDKFEVSAETLYENNHTLQNTSKVSHHTYSNHENQFLSQPQDFTKVSKVSNRKQSPKIQKSLENLNDKLNQNLFENQPYYSRHSDNRNSPPDLINKICNSTTPFTSSQEINIRANGQQSELYNGTSFTNSQLNPQQEHQKRNFGEFGTQIKSERKLASDYSCKMSTSDPEEFAERKIQENDSDEFSAQESSSNGCNEIDNAKDYLKNFSSLARNMVTAPSLVPHSPLSLMGLNGSSLVSPATESTFGHMLPRTGLSGPMMSPPLFDSGVAFQSPFDGSNQTMSSSTSSDIIIARAIAAARGSRKPRNEKKPIPSNLKDIRYYERRKRNNAAAKKSRDARKKREDEIAKKASMLESENTYLKKELLTLKAQCEIMSADLIRRGFPLLSLLNMNNFNSLKNGGLNED